MTIRRLLVANRGEIAARIFRTCDRLGIDTVAVAPPDDAEALHVRHARSATTIASYLDPAALVGAARETEADAIHPGYGFLSESAVLAEAVLEAGLVWVGPPPDALRRGGDKVLAKRLAADAGVPTLPTGSPDELGLPLLVKAAAGGGGRGMRVVRSEAELDTALAAASREAEAAFGDGAVYCERWLERPRHIEAQLVAHEDGASIVGLRDCSLQRRHQKVIEEAPPVGLPDTAEAAIRRGAAAFAEAIGYRSLGTAEFLVDGDDVWFLELNARIQVEHPVTEAVTGLDLVELQLRIAAGERPTIEVDERGHAIEARLYAEDPRGFLPRSGRIDQLTLPAGVRVDDGVEAGDEVGTRYDPLIAKLIAHGETRADALHALREALGSTRVTGVESNLPFLRWAAGHPTFVSGPVTTAFLVEHPPLSPYPRPAPNGAWVSPWRLNLPPAAVQPPLDATVESDAAAHHGGGGDVVAPMPGTVLAVEVRDGDEVEPRQRLVVLEAMKLEHVVPAPLAGKVSYVAVAPGDVVQAGSLLVTLDPADD